MSRTGRAKIKGAMGLVLLLCATAALGGIANTKHNLSASGPGSYTATTELQLCLACHTPHNANPADPLWNHTMSGATYTNVYDSSTLVAAPGQPTGRSRLCLSCHDGTVAVGSVKHLPLGVGAGTIAGLEATLSGAASLSTDLSDDHPISFGYDATLAINNGELVTPASLDADIRLESGELQCTTCHDPHVEDVGGSNPKFLRRGYVDGSGFGSPLCLECHDKTGWSTSVHRNSDAYWNGAGTNPFHLPGHMTAGDAVNSTVKKNGCESCHQPHNAPSGDEQLLKYDVGSSEDSSHLCMRCHNANVSDPADPTYNMNTPFGYTYNHMSLNASYDGRHLPVRDATTDWKVREGSYYTSITGGPADNLGANRHAECVDCHNPHQAQKGVSPNFDDPASGYPGQAGKTGGGTSNRASSVLKGVWGVQPGWGSAPADADWGTAFNGVMSWPGTYSDTYTEVDDIQYQYQLCLKCHSYYAYGPNPPQDPWNEFNWAAHGINGPGWNGQQTDQSMEFNPNNPAFHPVAASNYSNNDFKWDVSPFTDYSTSLLGDLSANSTMGCVDCHSNENYVELGLPKGPHGSSVWPNIWAPYDGNTGRRSTMATHICFKCHRADSYGASGCSDNHASETGYGSSSRGNLHCYHVNGEDLRCTFCHNAVPHGWKRPHLLIAGRGPNPDPAPYNNHGHYPRGFSDYNYGLHSDMFGAITWVSGGWSKSKCHNYSMSCGG